MTEFEEYKHTKFIPYINRIKSFLKNVHKITTEEEVADFYMSLEYDMPTYQGDFDKLTENELKTNSFLCELDDICENTEPFSDCVKENRMLLALMEKYGYI